MSTDFAFGPFILDRHRGRLLREGQPAAVSSKGLQLLEALLGSPGRVLTKAELMRAAWGDAAVEESNLSVQIAALRKQLALLWQILSGTGFPNQFFCDSWEVGFWRGRPWLAGHRIGRGSLDAFSSRFWIGLVTRRGAKYLPFTCLG